MVTLSDTVRPARGSPRATLLGMGLGGRLGIAAALAVVLWSAIALGLS